MNLLNLAKVTKSNCIFAHVRAATPGLPVIQLNCHPFTHGPFSFMHNGHVGGFKELRRSLMRGLSDDSFQTISGSTDSEYIFALFLDHFSRLYKVDAEEEKQSAMKGALAAAIKEIETASEEAGLDEPILLNLAVTDGDSTVVTRHTSHATKEAPSLYIHADGSLLCEDGHLKMKESDAKHRSVVIASEPLGSSEKWRAIEPNMMVSVNKELRVEIIPLDDML